jgi:hypothetical protein
MKTVFKIKETNPFPKGKYKISQIASFGVGGLIITIYHL